jgi:glutathione S-transferase
MQRARYTYYSHLYPYLTKHTLQVPVICSPSLDKPIADSLDITHYLSTFYPSLIPTSHKERITKGLQDLHALNYFSPSFPGRDHVAQGFKAAVVKQLSREISERYREALNYKLGM